MSYQALARKWRPGVFADVVGQEHVVQALSNALDRNQVHHAFLFSGTRGVGKTTLARIFAKALNCEQGVSAKPCNECSACQAIDQARFLDLIEVDAASRTRVDDTRELLDNVQYSPTSGRYKVYLIDEVHMLSGHSFNALLKTLEEPPPHVKFLLATTDPQKLPVTVLSRCLQFHLKALQPDQIHHQLQTILKAEQIEFEDESIDLLSRVADGSLRDALSLLDQALAYGAGQLQASMVRNMLGTIEDDVIEKILRALANDEAQTLLQVVVEMAERSSDYLQALDGILSQIYNLSLYQVSPGILRAKQAEQPWHAELAATIGAEDLQLYYQIGLIGKRDLALAPDPRTGFEMVLLRMLAFKPGSGDSGGSKARPQPVEERTTKQVKPVAAEVSAGTPATAPQKPGPEPRGRTTIAQDQGRSDFAGAVKADLDDWWGLVEKLPVIGVVRELAMNLGLNDISKDVFNLILDPSHEYLYDSARIELINAEIKKLGVNVTIKVEISKHDIQTPAQQLQRLREEKLRAAEQAISDDPKAQALQEKFGATLVKESIRLRE